MYRTSAVLATEASTPSEPLRGRWELPLAIVGLTTLFALVYTLRIGVSALERGEAFDWGPELAKVLAHWWASLLFVPLLARLVRVAPVARRHWIRHAMILLAGTVVASVGRALLDPPLALLMGETLPPLLRATRVLAAFGSFLAVVVMLHAAYYYREMRAREHETARLARSLAEAQLMASEARLSALRSQLQPHFLFNTLNAIAALLHSEPWVADRMLTRLAELLRSILRAPPGEEHALRDELVVLDQYLDVMVLRFGPRLTINRSFDATLMDVAVPWLVLQPIVENALEHGIWPRTGRGTLSLEAARVNGHLRLVVQDDGVGMKPMDATDGAGGAGGADGVGGVDSADGVDGVDGEDGAEGVDGASGADGADGGIGLANTRRRLAHLYGDLASLAIEPCPGGGTRVIISMPLGRSSAEVQVHG